MKDCYDLMIVGGGVVGLSAALAMAQRGYDVAVVDASPLHASEALLDSRVYALNHASEVLLEDLGVWSLLDKKRCASYQAMHVWDAQQGAHIDFHARLIGCDHLGVMIEESTLKEALLQRLAAFNVSLYFSSPIKNVQETAAGFDVISEHATWQTSWMIVADGGDSWVRKLLNVPLCSWSYHQRALVARVQHEKPHQNTAYQVFHPEGSLAFLPLADPHQSSIVWSLDTKLAQTHMLLSSTALNQAMTLAFEHRLGLCDMMNAPRSYPLMMRHATQYAGKKWILMGDAAHTIHPLAGLGLNVGLADLNAWLKIIQDVPHLKFSSKMLGAYQRQRKYAVWQVIAGMDALKWAFTHRMPSFVAARGIGLRLCNRSALLKRLFIEQASFGVTS